MDAPENQPEPQAAPAASSETEPAPKPALKPFDFRHPVFLSSAEWRKLRFEVNEFVESLAALLSTYFRLEFDLQVSNLRTIPFNEFVAEVPSPTHLALFKLEPHRGISVLEIRPKLGLAMVERLLGGPGKPGGEVRNLTEMEIALLDQVVHMFLSEWCRQWVRIDTLQGRILGHENNPKFLQTSSGDTILFVVTLEARINDCVDQAQIAIPFSIIEPLVKKLAESAPAASASASAAPANGAAAGTSQATAATPATPALKWNRNFDDMPLTISAQWPSIKMKARAVLSLKVGEILPLKPETTEKIELRIGKIPKFKGRLGTREGNWAIQITEICK